MKPERIVPGFRGFSFLSAQLTGKSWFRAWKVLRKQVEMIRKDSEKRLNDGKEDEGEINT